MSDDSRLQGKIKRQITRFAGRLTDGWANPLRPGLVGQMLYGIQAAEDVKVSNIARSLNEAIPLIKTENRLCRNLARADLTDRINRFLVWEGAGHVDANTVLALDLGDLRKEYAKAMEHPATVRDGSTGELAKGYWLCEVIAAHPYVVIGTKAKLSLIFKRVCEKAKRFYEIATFYQYAVADGIHRPLFASPSGPLPPPLPSDPGQLLLAFAKPPT